MAKRTASMKPSMKTDSIPVQKKITREEIEQIFNEAKEGLLMKISAQVKQASRADVVLALWNKAQHYDLYEDQVKSTVERIEEYLKAAATKISDIDFESFISDDYDDPISDLVFYFEPDDKYYLSTAFIYGCAFEAIRPYGEQLEQLRYQVLGNLEAIKED